MEAVSESVSYLFAVAGGGHPLPTPAVALPSGFGPLRAVPGGEFVAFVSSYSGPAVSTLAQAELPARLLVHQQVLEKLVAGGSILPVRLATTLADDAAVEAFLTASAGELASSLARTRGQVEVDIAAIWDIKAVLARIAGDPEVVAAREAAQAGPAADRQAAAVGLGQLVQAKLEQIRGGVSDLVAARLEAIGSEVVANPLTSQDLVCNVAVLIAPEQLAEVDSALHAIDEELGGRFDFRRVGPLSPFSFATVELRRVEPEEIARANALFGLAEPFDEQAVLDRYRELALASHPDRSQAADAARDFETLTAAKATLLEVARLCGGRGQVPATPIVTAAIQGSTGIS
ncbi:MAG: GvpL/GvpF family gas vesicle protein [Candidatus Nanopelagicales bacterium]